MCRGVNEQDNSYHPVHCAYTQLTMHLFATENLSPLPTTPLPCALPYALNWEDLLPILPGFDRNCRDLAQAFASHRKQGLNGGENSIILTLRYPGGGDELLSRIVFVKSQTDLRKREAEKYRYLDAHGVPTPRLLAELRKGDAEVIVLEFLPKIVIDFNSHSEVNDLLHLVAQVNSLPISLGLFDSPPGMPQEEFDRLVYAALQRMDSNPALPGIDVPRWFAAYQQCQEDKEQMPLAVNHNEFFFQQTGWAQRGTERKLVIFDLETMCVRPRLTDLASILYPLSRYTGQAQEDLLHGYLDYLHPHTNDQTHYTDALRELRILRIVESCYSLPWLSGESVVSDDFDTASSLSMAADCVRADLTVLGLA